MNFELSYTENYKKEAKKFIKGKSSEFLKRYDKVLELLEDNPHHPSLRLHKLTGKLKDLHSVSINMQYRIIIDFIIIDKRIILLYHKHLVTRKSFLTKWQLFFEKQQFFKNFIFGLLSGTTISIGGHELYE